MDNQDLRQDFLELLNSRYEVEDLIPVDCRVLFLLESPYLDDVEYGTPGIGDIGIALTKEILGEAANTPLGLMIKATMESGENNSIISRIGIMNICRIPMQQKVYSIDDRCRYRNLIRILQKLRKNYTHKIHHNENWNIIEDLILNSLNRRLNRIAEKVISIIPCGNFANYCLGMSNDSGISWKVYKIPHPSFRHWGRLNTGEQIREALKATFPNSLHQF